MLIKSHCSALQLCLVASTLTCATAASAQTTPYTSRTTFNAALSTTASNDLNALANGSTVISFGPFGNATLSNANVTGGKINNPNTGGAYSFTITFSQLLNGFGADFTSPANLLAATAYINAFNGSTFLGGWSLGNQASSNPSFLGISTVGGFNRIVVSESGPFPGLQLFQSVDNLTVGVSPVPEPANISMFLAGLAIVGGLYFRRSQAT